MPYTIRVGCQQCGRTFTFSSDTPKVERVCPHSHKVKK